MSWYPQFWMLLPKARGQWAHDTAAAITLWLGTAAASCAFVPVSSLHVCTSMPMSIYGSVCAHGHIHAWLQAILLSSAVPSQAFIGTGRALDIQQGSGSSGQLPPWQLSRESSCLAATSGDVVGWEVSATHHAQGLGQASCSWLPAYRGKPQLCTPILGDPCLPLHAGQQGWHHILCWAAPLPFPGHTGGVTISTS